MSVIKVFLAFAGWIYSWAVRHESIFIAWMKIGKMHRVRWLVLLFGVFLDTCFSLKTRGFIFSSPVFEQLKSPWASGTSALIYLLEQWPLGFWVSGPSNILWQSAEQWPCLASEYLFLWVFYCCFWWFLCGCSCKALKDDGSWVNMGSQRKRLLRHHGVSLLGLQTTDR